MLRFLTFAALAVSLLAAPMAQAQVQATRTERVSFAAGASGTVLTGRVQGYDTIDYVLNARGGQRMVVDMTTTNPSAYFNVMPAGNPQAIHIGSTAGLHFDGALPQSGDWVVRVYLMRNAARRGETADYRLSISIQGGGAAPTDDFADGNAGGPDFWRVNASSLNIRSGPSTAYGAIMRASRGQVFRNLGCQGYGNDRWCRLQTPNGSVTGWAAGRFLVESRAPGTPAPQPPTGDFADSLSGGPDWWEVSGVAANDTLNIRSGPSMQYQTVFRARNGVRLRNMGCQMNGSTRWCHVETSDGTKSGWASGRYLREGSAPGNGGGVTLPTGSPITPELHIRTSGEIEARWSSGCVVFYNAAKRRINAGSTCSPGQLAISDATVKALR